MKRKYKTVIAVVGALLAVAVLVPTAYNMGRRTGAREADANATAGSALSNALRVHSDIAMARSLRSTDSNRVITDLEGHMLLNAVLMGISASPDSTDSDTAEAAHRALGDLNNYIHDHPSAVLTNKRATLMIQRSREQIDEWFQVLTNAPKRAPWGIAYDKKAVISD